jgi:23S rRNA (uridine2552-2'-O)-methyltransferase
VANSKRWLEQHRKDQYVQQARSSNYRSRAVYKLIEIDAKDQLIKPGQTVVDLGAAPGSWSQYVSDRVGKSGLVIAVDLLPMEPIAQVRFINGDFTENSVYLACLDNLSNRPADLVISDMAPNLTGIRNTDQARSMYLAELVYEFSVRVLRPGGSMLVKMFQGEGADHFRKELINKFQSVMVRKPKASRDDSREFYILAKGYVV